MRRLTLGTLIPLLLALTGVALIMVGQLGLDRQPASSLPPIPDPSSPVAVATASPLPSGSASPGASALPEATPSPTPLSTATAVQLEIESIGLNVAVQQSRDPATDDFPPLDSAYILRASSQPGRGENSYMFAHAYRHLFKPLWNVYVGAEVKVLMSDGRVLRYIVTEVRPNISCPDDRADPHPNPPLALKYAPPGCAQGAAWTQPTGYERLTLQTSQGYNRNWGELVVIARPVT